jgi:protein-S-isoprenylcysteine O-methyltransferase Ste14
MHQDVRAPKPVASTAGAVLVAAVVGAAAVTAVMAVRGEFGRAVPVLAAIAVGTLLVLLFFLAGQVPVRLAPLVGGGAGFLLLGLGYVLRLLLLLVAMRAVTRADWLAPEVVGVTVVLGALIWLNVHAVRHFRAARRTPVLELELPTLDPR